MTDESKVRDLRELLEQAGRRHHEAFIATDGDDPEWPLWYAEYLQDRITATLGARPTRSRLVQCLLNAEEQHASEGSDFGWSDFYARYILGLDGGAMTSPPDPGDF